MVGADQFPLFRLGTLVARQLSAPVAARVKVSAAPGPGPETRPWASFGDADVALDTGVREAAPGVRARRVHAGRALSPGCGASPQAVVAAAAAAARAAARLRPPGAGHGRRHPRWETPCRLAPRPCTHVVIRVVHKRSAVRR